MPSLDNLPPRPLSLILQFLDERDRLNLRLVCKELEETISLTDLNLGDVPTLTTITICSGRFEFLVGNRIRFYIDNNEHSRAELLRIRQRLYKKLVTHSVHLLYINYNEIPLEYVDSLLGDCVFRELWIDVERDGFHSRLLEFVHKYANKEVKLIMHDFLLVADTLLSLPRLQQLSVVKVNDDSFIPPVDDEQFLALLRIGHVYVDIPVHPLTPETLREATKIVGNSSTDQFVTLHVPSDLIVQFMAFIGLRRVGDLFEHQPNSDKEFEIDYCNDDPCDVPIGADSESFTLKYRKASINLDWPFDKIPRQITIWISNLKKI
ncbi:hypothetical protein PFISCL1PPCAC_14464 [Pristionchus fissidentatus]|uniref:F-box domain-containing protein n=1 Tax=Pristionchus fissidentatus TaxID=1538716 RepID=A0AAV5VU04_9BILA|nr:hypothetical protein PFISCL1PPCAC_14464 [Pristionchus fissidentatus]